MTRRAVLVVAGALLLLLARPAAAHVGSPDVFYEGDAGPYHLFVVVRMPQVIPGIATIEVRTRGAEVSQLSVVPLRLTGPGSELPPTPDRAERSATDPQFFTASLWLMEHGSLQVRVNAQGSKGPGALAVPLAAVAQRTLGMDRALGAVLLALMLLLALSLVSIAGGAVREAGLDPGETPSPDRRRRVAVAMAIASVVVAALLWFGNAWWRSEAKQYASFVQKPWLLEPKVSGCTLTLPAIRSRLLPDHGHDVHLFVVRTPALDRLAHLHPVRQHDGSFAQTLPSLPAGTYTLFADIVTDSGFPVTGTATLVLPELSCPELAGDDSAWAQGQPSSIVLDPPTSLHAGVAQALRVHVVGADGKPATDVEPYMAMAGHAAVVRTDLSVFAHLHPTGSVAMPALMLAGSPHTMYDVGQTIGADIGFPYGFPTAGNYRVFVQVKRAGHVETGAFDLAIVPQ